MSSTRLAKTVSVSTVVVGIVVGEAAMIFIMGLAARFGPSQVILQWLIGAIVIAVGGYLLFGEPQIRAWERQRSRALPESDVRSRWALHWLLRDSRVAFVIASIIGGPTTIAWFYASHPQLLPRARKATALAAIYLALFWAAVYLGAIHWLAHSVSHLFRLL